MVHQHADQRPGTADAGEVRRLDNRYAILLIRGAGPVMDLKYDLMKHPAVRQTSLLVGRPIFITGSIKHR